MMMDSPPKLSGETLIVHHIPLVHCQVPDRQCKRSNPFGQPDLGPLQTVPLLEQDFLQADSLVRLRRIPSDPAEPVPALETPPEEGRAWDPGASRRQNPFLLSEDEEPLEDNGPLGQRSFRLHSHGQPAFHLHSELSLPPFRLHNAGHGAKPWGATVAAGQHSDNTVDGKEDRGKKRRPESMELDEYSCHRERDPSDSSSEQDWAGDPDGELGPGPEAPRSRTCSCSSGSEIQRCRCCSLSSQSEPLDHQMGYASDSSCNSSDGVLVNFSALYHKMNGHPPNLNSCEEESSSGGSHSDTGGGGAFYLDLHSSPQEAKLRCPEPLGTACPCHGPSSPVLDANCNSYDPCGSGGSSSDLTACFQSQARLVVATQNYYKLVTCDLSSQSSPSPAGSSITSCSEEQARVSSPPLQPTEYYLFQRPAENAAEEPRGLEASDATEPNANTVEGQLYVNISPPTLATGRQRSRSYDRNLDRSPSAAGRLGSLERMMSCPVKLSEGPHSLALQSSPPKRVTSFAELAKGRKKNGGSSSSSSGNNNNSSSSGSPPFRASRDSSLEFSPIPEHRRGGSGGGGSGSVFLEDRGPRHSQSLPPMPWIHSLQHSPEEEEEGHGSGAQETSPYGQPFLPSLAETGGLGQKDVRARADGGAADGKVFRYSKDQRPTTLPIQPFVFQHHFPRQPKARALQSHLAASLSQLYSRSSSAGRCAAAHPPPSAAASSAADQPMPQRSADGATCPKKPPPAPAAAPETTRPSPLGSYSPIRSHGGPFFQSGAADSASSSSSSSSSILLPTPDGHPPRSRSCPVSANLLPVTSVAGPSPATAGHSAKEEIPAPLCRKDGPPEFELGEVNSLPPLLLAGGLGLARAGGTHPEAQWKAGCGEALVSVGSVGTVLSRPLNAHHLSPQALKWREYRRRNPLGLGLDRGSSSGTSGSGLDGKPVPPEPEGRLSRRNPLFELPGALGGGRPYARLNGHSVKQLQLNYSDFFPDYFSLAEKPPAEFCLSPDGNTESISIDLLQKKGLVKAVNMAVDLIVAHFGTSRDPGVKAKLGNSSVSPNVGHLILKYLCPAIREVLSDGLKAYVLDIIIGQRRNVPWSVVEASTQLGPSTKVLHGLYSKVSQYPELTSHTMRFNAFIFGLLNIRSLEFWFNHLYNHEDVLQAHYQPVGFLALSQGVCQGLFEELLLLLQPLSLLPFDLDLLFEHHRLQMGREQRQKKELLRIRQDLLLSAHSTLQLMRTPGQSGGPNEEDGEEEEEEDPRQRRSRSSGSGSSVLGWGPKKTPKMEEEEEEAAPVQRVKGVGAPSRGKPEEEVARRQWPEGPKRDKQASWWFQLMQSSQVYIEGPSEGPRAIRYERKAKKPGPTTKKMPPPREGVVEGAEACPIAAEVPLKDRPSLGPTTGAPQKPYPPEKEKDPHRRPSWMGSPPESVLTELKHSKAKEDEGPQKTGSPPKESGPGAPLANQPKWGCLFGSRKAPKDPKQPPNRLPSGWLSLDRSIFQLVAQTVGAASGAWREAHPDPERLAPDLPPLRPKHRTPLPLMPMERSKAQEGPCQVKALCHHIATEAGQLSFQKGDLLRVLGKADADWLRCGRGAESGLVPVMYVTHAEDQDY